MTALVPVVVGRSTGVDMTAAGVATTPTTGDTFPAGPNTYLRIRNATASAVTVTVNPPAGGGPDGTTVAPLALAPTVAASPSGDRMYGPFPANPFADTNGNVNFTCTGAGASVTASAYIFPAG